MSHCGNYTPNYSRRDFLTRTSFIKRETMARGSARMYSLTTLPERYGVARENDLFDDELRCLRHYSHRILYTVNHEFLVVQVHAVLHGSKDDLSGDEF